MIPSGFISTSSASMGLSRTSAASLANGSTDRPWKELVQSTCDGSSSVSFIGWSERPDVRDAVPDFDGTAGLVVVVVLEDGGWVKDELDVAGFGIATAASAWR
jgi:hypothetical protein